jgi:hypothetical protein
MDGVSEEGGTVCVGEIDSGDSPSLRHFLVGGRNRRYDGGGLVPPVAFIAVCVAILLLTVLLIVLSVYSLRTGAHSLNLASLMRYSPNLLLSKHN